MLATFKLRNTAKPRKTVLNIKQIELWRTGL